MSVVQTRQNRSPRAWTVTALAPLVLGVCLVPANAQPDCPAARSNEDRLMRADLASDENDYDLAIRHLTCVYNSAQVDGDAVEAAAASLALGQIYERDGRNQDALQQYERGLGVLAGDSTDTELFVGDLLDRIRGSEKRVPDRVGTPGGLDVYRGEIAALDLLVGEDDEIASRELAIVLAINAGNLYLLQDQHQQAELYYTQALGQVRSTDQHLLEARILANLAWNAIRQGHYAEASALLREALEDTPPESRVALRRAVLAVAVNEREQGQYQEAVEDLTAALELYRSVDDNRGLAVALSHLGTAQFQSGQLEQARLAYAEALSVNEEVDERTIRLHANGGLARTYQALGDAEKAEEHYDRYFKSLGHFSNSWKTDQGRVAIFEDQQAVFEAYVTAALEAAVKTGDFAVARRAAERGRARVLPTLMKSRANDPRPEPGRITATPFLYGDNWPTVQSALNAAAAPTDYLPPNQATNTPVQMAISVEDLERGAPDPIGSGADLAAQAGSAVPNSGALGKSATAQNISMPTFLEYFSTKDKTLGLVRRPDGAVHGVVVEIGAKTLASQVDEYLRTLDVQRPRGVLVSAAVVSGSATGAPAATADELARSLYDHLIAPVRPYLPEDPTENVVIVPHLSLWRLPFAALTDGTGSTLSDQHALSYVSSEEAWRLLAERPRLADIRDLNAWIVGNPAMPDNVNRCGVDVSLGALPGAEEEAREISRLFEGESAQLFLGSQADNFRLSAWHSDPDVLHLATHGLACPGDPLSSFIALSEVAAANLNLDRSSGRMSISGDPRLPVTLSGWDQLADKPDLEQYEDPSFGGLLDARTVITEFRLDADLVTLSACQTGLGQLSGEGMIGFTRAFLAAGSRSLLVSLWKVDDDATKTLMLQFYREYLEHGDKARALQSAMGWTQVSYPDPRHWAAFTLVGLSE